jgi:hypothetical protein
MTADNTGQSTQVITILASEEAKVLGLFEPVNEYLPRLNAAEQGSFARD